MKKNLRIFIFFIIAISLLFVNEVYAALGFDTENKKYGGKANAVGRYEYVIVVHNKTKSEELLRQKYECGESQYDKASQTLDFTGWESDVNDTIQVFVYYERPGAKGNDGAVSVTKSSGDVEWKTIGTKVDTDGYNSLSCLWEFTLKSEKTTTTTFYMDGDVEDIYVTLEFYIEPEQEVEPEPEPIVPVEPSLNYDTECDKAQENLGNDGLQVVICQGTYIDRSYSYADNDKNYTIDLTTTTFQMESDLVFFIYAEQNYITDDVNVNFSYTSTPNGGISTVSRKVECDDEGRNSIQGMYRWKFEQEGTHTIKVTLTGKNVGTTITLIVKAEKGATPPEGTHDFNSVMGNMEDELKNGQVAIKLEQFADGKSINITDPIIFKGITTGETNKITVDFSDIGTVKRNTEFRLYVQLEKSWLDECSVTGLEKYGAAGEYGHEKNVYYVINNCGIDKGGTNSANVGLKFNVGKVGTHEIKFTIDTDECDVEVTLKIRIGTNLRFTGCSIDYEKECEIAEDELDNEGLKIIVASGNRRVTYVFKNVNESQPFTLYPCTRIKFDKEDSYAVFAYYECDHIATKDYYFGLGDMAQPNPISIVENQCEIDTNWRNAFSGLLWGGFNENAGDIVIIPIIMKTKVGSNVREFKINIHIDFTQEVTDFYDFITNAGEYRPTYSEDDYAGLEKLENKAGIVLSTISNIGIIASIIILMILGIKYMLGSVEEKADYKKDLVPYLVGACLLFGISTFVKILQAVGNTINNI